MNPREDFLTIANNDTGDSSAQSAAATTDASDPIDYKAAYAASQVELEKVQGHANEMRTENKKYRQGKADAVAAEKAATEARQTENGEHKALAESRAAEIEALTTSNVELAKKAQAYDSDILVREAALASSLESLDAATKALVLSAGTISQREALAQRFTSAPVNGVVDKIDNKAGYKTGILTAQEELDLSPEDYADYAHKLDQKSAAPSFFGAFSPKK